MTSRGNRYPARVDEQDLEPIIGQSPAPDPDDQSTRDSALRPAFLRAQAEQACRQALALEPDLKQPRALLAYYENPRPAEAPGTPTAAKPEAAPVRR